MNGGSLFSQKLDRAVFCTYFLGAVMPLLGLGLVVHRYAMPAVSRDTNEAIGLIAGMSALAILCLSCFLALRRLTHGALDRMDADNGRLAKLLAAASDLAGVPHADVVAGSAARGALALTDAAVALVVSRATDDKEAAVLGSEGQRSLTLYEANRELIDELAESAMGQEWPARLEPGEAMDASTLSAGVAFALSGGAETAALVVLHTESGAEFSTEQVASVATLAGLTSVALSNAELLGAQRNFFTHVIDLLVTALDAHVENRRDHAMRVAALANRVGRELGFEEDRLQRLHFASLLHDIGMLKIDLSHQKDPKYFQKHPILAYRLLSRIQLWKDLAPIVLHHHEWFDGSGYPEGIAGEDIPLEARIIAAVDAADAMSRTEHGRPGLDVAGAVSELRANSGTQFDPKVVAAFAALVERGDVYL